MIIDTTKLNAKQVKQLAEQIAPNMGAKIKPAPTTVNPAALSDKAAAKSIAKEIYNSKGLLSDDEKRAVNAVKRIRDNKMFELVQIELKKLTGGRGLGQYIVSFIQDGIYQAHYKLNYLNAIIGHLKKIKVNRLTISILDAKKAEMLAKNKEDEKLDQAIGGPELRQFWKDHHHPIHSLFYPDQFRHHLIFYEQCYDLFRRYRLIQSRLFCF
jgi:hypothetical protein